MDNTFGVVPRKARLQVNHVADPHPTIQSPLSLIPRLVAGIDIRTLPLKPEDAFVLSRIDGTTSVRDIGYCTGLPESTVESSLHVLERLGVVDYHERPRTISAATAVAAPAYRTHSGSAETGTTQPPTQATPQPPPPDPQPQVETTGTPPVSRIPPLPAYDPDELSAASDLDEGRRKAILDLFYQLDTLDYYALLGVRSDADRKAVKGAYYERVKVFHPDRYYGKELGHYRKKLEVAFARLTEAHDTLTNPDSRTEYDGYLKSQVDAAELERAINTSVTAADFDDLERRLKSALAASAPQSASDPGHAFPQSEPEIRFHPSSPAPPSRQLTEDDRKKALARKLRLSQPSMRIPSQASMSAVQPRSASIPPKEQIAEQLKRQYEQSRRAANLSQLSTLVTEADEALSQGDPVRAANALRTAQSIAPQDPAIAERLTQAQQQAAVALSDTYLKQGEYEEKSGRWEAAARSYERAARGKPSAIAWESAARCLLEAQGDMRAAGEFMRKAMAAEPGRPTSHLLLGRIFMAARMRSSAIAELERARSLDPNNDTVASLLKRLERESF